MSDYAQIHASHVRLAILKLLEGAPGYSANDSILTHSMEQLGLACTRDQMRSHLAWLKEQLAIITISPLSGMIVATLTERGADLAHGRSSIPGVQRPSPGHG